MASSEMALIRSSLRLLRRSVTTRTIVAAERRSLPRTFATPAVRHLRTRATPPQRKPEPVKDEPALNTQLAHTLQESDTSDLVSEVNIPDDPNGVLQRDHPAVSILNNSSLVIQRQLEMMNVLVGFEQANRYIVMNGEGETVGYIAEQDHGIGRSIARQMARTHRSFTTYIFDKDQREVLRIHRPFAFINTKIRIYDAIGDATPSESTAMVAGHQNFIDNAQVSPLKIEEMKIVGECQSQWTALRRKYNLFSMRSSRDVSLQQADEGTIESQMQQFSMIDEPMLSWDFTVKEEDGKVIGSVNRNFGGFAREIFTDTGVYALRMDAAARTSALENADGKEIARYEVPGLTLDQRAVLIATAVSIDFDYFSRHSHSGGFMPMYIPMGGVAAEGAAATGGVEAVGGAVAGTAARGAAGAGMGAIETGAVGAGTMAGYEAMQRGAYGSGDDASPQAVDPQSPEGVEQMENQPGDDGVWGAEQDPWSESAPEASEGGGGWISTIMDFFNDS